MKIFALYTNVTLTKKPEWLNGFLEKYQLRGLHVTLKQPCFIEEKDIEALKQKVAQFFSLKKFCSIEVVFDDLIYNKEETGAIMVCARNADKLLQMQKDLCIALSEYGNYVEPMRETYEKNFKPHITIGDEIPQERYGDILNFLKNGCHCEGIINEVVLAIVNDMARDESNNPSNKTTYSLLESD